jgi:hypothetical protein
MKMPAQVTNKVTRNQREFLWGGVKGGRKLSWIKWKVVFQEKENGALRVHDIKMVNLSLLMNGGGGFSIGKIRVFGRRSWRQSTMTIFFAMWFGQLCQIRDLHQLGGKILVMLRRVLIRKIRLRRLCLVGLGMACELVFGVRSG